MDALLSSQGMLLLGACTIGSAVTIAMLLRSTEPVHSPASSAVLVTGGSRGIGKSIAYHMMDKGYVVFCTVRSQSQYDQLDAEEGAPCPVLLDVTQDNQVDVAVKRVKELCAEKGISLVAIVNNAGINPEGDDYQKQLADNKTTTDELCDPAVASRVFETNVVGVIRVTRAFLPLLSTNGRIVNLGSYFGSIAGQLGLRQASYEASKFALEGLSDNVRRALKKDKRSIRVSLIKPGNIATGMNSYGEVGPEVVALDVEHAIGSANPKARYYPGKVQGHNARFLCWLFDCLPTSITDKL